MHARQVTSMKSRRGLRDFRRPALHDFFGPSPPRQKRQIQYCPPLSSNHVVAAAQETPSRVSAPRFGNRCAVALCPREDRSISLSSASNFSVYKYPFFFFLPSFLWHTTGGAERLVVDAALALQQNGFEVVFFTSHHDPQHCFRETADGTLPVRVYGDFLPRSIFGRFAAACAYLRSLWAACCLLVGAAFASGPSGAFDAIIVDSISISIPLLCLFGRHRVRMCSIFVVARTEWIVTRTQWHPRRIQTL
jgi:hypothetical protein